jgi:hypothetical protein
MSAIQACRQGRCIHGASLDGYSRSGGLIEPRCRPSAIFSKSAAKLINASRAQKSLAVVASSKQFRACWRYSFAVGTGAWPPIAQPSSSRPQQQRSAHCAFQPGCLSGVDGHCILSATGPPSMATDRIPRCSIGLGRFRTLALGAPTASFKVASPLDGVVLDPTTSSSAPWSMSLVRSAARRPRRRRGRRPRPFTPSVSPSRPSRGGPL